MFNKNFESMDKAAYMFDKETNQAWDKLQSNIHAHEKERKHLSSFKHRPLLKIAASIALLIGISWISLTIFNQEKTQIAQTKAFQSTKVLPDGTTVYLNAYSKIEFPQQFSSNNRKIKFSGEAFFDVTKDPERPFIIMAEDVRVEVLGTSFNISTNKEANKVEVLVESGTVSLSSTANHEKLILTKGQAGFSKNKFLSRNKINDLNYLSWKTKRIDFNEAPLGYVISVLNKTYTSNIIIKAGVSSNLKLNAKFDKAPLDTVLKSICLAFDLKQNQMDGKIQLVNKSK